MTITSSLFIPINAFQMIRGNVVFDNCVYYTQYVKHTGTDLVLPVRKRINEDYEKFSPMKKQKNKGS